MNGLELNKRVAVFTAGVVGTITLASGVFLLLSAAGVGDLPLSTTSRWLDVLVGVSTFVTGALAIRNARKVRAQIDYAEQELQRDAIQAIRRAAFSTEPRSA